MDDESTIRRLFDQKIAREATNPTPTQPETLEVTAMTKHDFRFTPEDHERMKATLDSLSDNPTEAEAEAVLQACGTSGKEVVNEFIERLLKENLELKQELDRRAAVAGPREWVEKEIAHAAGLSNRGRFEEAFNVLVHALRAAATSSPTPAAPSVVDAIAELIKMRDEYADDERVTRPVNTLNAAIERLAFANSNATPAERTRVEGEQGTWYCLDCDSQQPIEGAWMCSDGNVRCAVHRQQFSGEQRAAAAPADNDAEGDR